MNRTPGLFSLSPTPKPVLSGKQLLYRLEDDYSDYRRDVNLGYCEDDPEVHAKFVAAISKAEGGAR
jgi:hypothetical protein